MRLLPLALLAACSPADTNIVAAVDSAPDGPRTNLATVEVSVFMQMLDPAPLVGVRVAFVDPGGYGFVVTTGVDGIARGEVVEGGSVTALVELPGFNPMLETMLGVHDGDKVRLGLIHLPYTPLEGTPACSEVDFTARFTNVAADIGAIYHQRRANNQTAWGDGAKIDSSTFEYALTGAGGLTAHLETKLDGPNVAPNRPAMQMIGEWIDGCATSYELDLSVMLPWMQVPTANGLQIDVPQTGGSLEGDLLTVSMGFETSATSGFGWTVLGPPVTSFKLPALPDELGAPAATDPYSVSAQLTDYELVDGYDEARGVLGGPSCLGACQTSTAFGRMRASYILQ